MKSPICVIDVHKISKGTYKLLSENFILLPFFYYLVFWFISIYIFVFVLYFCLYLSFSAVDLKILDNGLFLRLCLDERGTYSVISVRCQNF